MASKLSRAASYPRSLVLNRSRRTDLPRFLTYIVTFACNARCVMCDSWQKPSKGDMDLREIEKALSKLPKMDAVRLSGGEPFYRKDLPEIAQLVERKLDPLFLHITTNGFLTKRIVDYVRARDSSVPLRMLVSVDGYGDKHNEVRGQPHAWERVTKTIAALAELRETKKFTLEVNQVIVDRESMEHHRRLRTYLDPLGVRLNVVFAYEQSATYSMTDELEIEQRGGGYSSFGDFLWDELRDFIDDLLSYVDTFDAPERLAKRYYLEGIASRLLGGAASPNPPCVALSSHLRLFPDGSVPTCQMNSKRAGNLLESDLTTLRASETFTRQRKWVTDCEGCWAECEVLPSGIYTGDLARSLRKWDVESVQSSAKRGGRTRLQVLS